MRSYWRAGASLVVVALLLLGITIRAHNVLKTALTVTPGTSNAGVLPVPPGGSSNENVRVYNYTVAAGSGIVDTIPVQVCITSFSNSLTTGSNTETLTSWSFQVGFGPDGAAGNLTVDSSDTETFSSSSSDGLNSCRTIDILLNTGALSDVTLSGVDYTANLLVNRTDSQGPHDHMQITVNGQEHIKIRVTVEPAAALECFVTDSSFNFLFLCDGTTEIKSGSAGRFAVVTNKKGTAVATNPGQFYYHVLWKNPDSAAKTVSVSFDRAGVHAHGAQAIHAGLFPPSFSGVSAADFQVVNDAIPSGADDHLHSVTVDPGWTLWVTYHLESDLIGTAPAGLGNVCADATIPTWTVKAILSGDTSGECTAGATAYLKK